MHGINVNDSCSKTFNPNCRRFYPPQLTKNGYIDDVDDDDDDNYISQWQLANKALVEKDLVWNVKSYELTCKGH